jgi:hypothetical protein
MSFHMLASSAIKLLPAIVKGRKQKVRDFEAETGDDHHIHD